MSKNLLKTGFDVDHHIYGNRPISYLTGASGGLFVGSQYTSPLCLVDQLTWQCRVVGLFGRQINTHALNHTRLYWQLGVRLLWLATTHSIDEHASCTSGIVLGSLHEPHENGLVAGAQKRRALLRRTNQRPQNFSVTRGHIFETSQENLRKSQESANLDLGRKNKQSDFVYNRSLSPQQHFHLFPTKTRLPFAIPTKGTTERDI